MMTKQTKFKLVSVSIGLTVLLAGLLGFIWIKNAQKESLAKQKSIDTLLSNTIDSTDKDTLKKSQKELADYIKQIESVSQFKLPLISCEECQLVLRDMQPKLDTINSNIQSVENLESAIKLALEAAILIQKPPHSADTWQKAQSKYQESIKLLENIKPNNVVFKQAKDKLTTYRKNLAYINNIYTLEKESVADLQESKKLVEEANRYINNEPKRKSDLEEAKSKLKQALKLLSKIPNGTTVTKSANEQLGAVLSNYQNVSVKLNNFIDPTEFNKIKCGTKFIDVEYPDCTGVPTLKNYSSDWYEINYDKDRWLNDEIKVFTLIPPGGKTSLFGISNDLIKIRKILGQPSKIVKINCNDKKIKIWGIIITPRCNSEGTYLDLNAESTLKTLITLDNGKTIRFENTIATQTGWIKNSSNRVEFTISIE